MEILLDPAFIWSNTCACISETVYVCKRNNNNVIDP